MKLPSLVACFVLTVSFLAPLCTAGPLILAFPAVGAVFGLTASTCFYGALYVANAALWTGWQIGARVFIGSAAAGGAAAAGVKAGDDANKKADASSRASVASVSSVSVASVESVSRVSVSSRLASWSSDFSDVQKSSVATVASAEALAEGAKAAAWSSHEPKYDVYTFSARGVPTPGPVPTGLLDPRDIVTTGIAPPPPGTSVAPLPPGYTPPGLPPGVPKYNFDMCMNDIVAMEMSSQSIAMGQPEVNSIRVDGIPSNCMVLATVIIGDPTLGPHPIPMGSASLQWNNVADEHIGMIRQFFQIDEPIVNQALSSG